MKETLSPNTTLSHYQIVSLLGAGGMGEVWLAEDTRLERKVALKLLPPEFTADADRLRRFVQEAKAASALNHPTAKDLLLDLKELKEELAFAAKLSRTQKAQYGERERPESSVVAPAVEAQVAHAPRTAPESHRVSHQLDSRAGVPATESRSAGRRQVSEDH
jgi:serine/threonine protein kinase